jgi:oxazoline/thiazoline synthase
MQFKNFFRIENIEQEATFFLTERNSSVLCGQLFQQLVLAILCRRGSANDGDQTVDEIVQSVQSSLLAEGSSTEECIFALAQIHYALGQLEQQNYLDKGEHTLPKDLLVFCNHLNIDPQVAEYRLQTTKVAVNSLSSELPAEQFKALLASLHIQVSDRADLEIILTDDYLQNDLDAYNQHALASSCPWMLIKPMGTIVWIGPVFQPGKTGCWRCLAQRLQGNRPVENFIQKRQNISTPLLPPLANLLSTSQTALGMAATEVFKWIVQGENHRLEGVLVTHDTLTLETKKHQLTKRPQCPSCGLTEIGQLDGEPLPVLLGHRKKPFLGGGEHRLSSPAETLKKYEHHISPITGVVRELLKVDRDANDLMFTYGARHHFATMFDDLEALRQYAIGRSGGTAPTDLRAKCSSFCEAIERYSGVFQGNEIRRKSSYRQLANRAIHPNTCMNFSPLQYQERQSWNDRHAGFADVFQLVPEPFDEEKEIEWTPVWSLTKQVFKYLPAAYCYYGYPVSLPTDCWADSNGCGAGNTLEEAILHGFMELVERDCVALWWYNRLQKPQVNLDSFQDPYFQSLQSYYQSIGRDFWVLDITSDLNIPAFAAISRRKDREVEDIVFDFGAHFDPKVAIYRAVNGMNKILQAVLDANPDGSTAYSSSMSPSAIDWWKTATIGNQPYLVADQNQSWKNLADYAQLWSDDLLEDVMTCQQIVERQGMELLILDQTRPDIGLKVVKVIVPGLRHFWRRLGSGRLYEVPVKLGWLKQPLQEHELNPFSMWM